MYGNHGRHQVDDQIHNSNLSHVDQFGQNHFSKNKFQSSSRMNNNNKNFINPDINVRGSLPENPESYKDEVYKYTMSYNNPTQSTHNQKPSYNNYNENQSMARIPSQNFKKQDNKPYHKIYSHSHLKDIRSPPSSHPYHNFTKIQNHEQYKEDNFQQQPPLHNKHQFKQNNLVKSQSYIQSPRDHIYQNDDKMSVLTSSHHNTHINTYQDDCLYMNLEEEYLHRVSKRNQNKFSNVSINRSMYNME